MLGINKVMYSVIGLFALCNGLQLYNPVVRPKLGTFNTQGSITGTILPGYRTPFIEAFLGVPFAEPPLGVRRFSNPVPFHNFWAYDHLATVEREKCLQKNTLLGSGEFPVEGSEDCLYLNIFRPLGTSIDKPLPVIILIHGGGLMSGSPSTLMYGPKYFMDNGEVILVTPAYRLGTIGFLSTGDNAIPGNFALKDQAMAMQWIKDNIILFNGDPNQITIMGPSAGAVSVHLHTMSPLSRNLFDRVGAVSGTAIAPFAYVTDDPLELTRRLAHEIGIANASLLSTSELAANLRAADPRHILEAGHIFRTWLKDPALHFGPVVEIDGPNAFLVEDPRLSISSGNYKNVPLLMTIVPEEGVVRTGSIINIKVELDYFNTNFDLAIGTLNSFKLDNGPELQSKIDQIIEFYFNGTRKVGPDNSQRLTDMFGDRHFHYPFYSAYKFQSKTVNPSISPLYLIEFNYRGPYSFSYVYAQSDRDFGVVHGDDMIYLCDNGLFPLFDFDSVEAKLVTEMVDIYVNFASGRIPHEKSTICTFDAADPDKPCEYLSIINSANGSGYEVTTANKINLDMINFWRGIDKLF